MEDKTDGRVNTGEMLEFSVNVSDNIGVVSVDVFYQFDDGMELNDSMANILGNIWNHSIDVPSIVTYLNYSFNISDAADNFFVTDMFSWPIGDDESPTAEAGENVTIDQHEEVTFNGDRSSDNIGIVNYTWTFGYDGIEYNLYDIEANFTFDIVGFYQVILNVSDKMGNWDTDYFTVTVRDITAPMADAGSNMTIHFGQTAYFNGSGSWDNVGIVNYTWQFFYNDTDIELQGMNTSFIFHAPRKYNITLTVSDLARNTASDILILTILRENDTIPDNDTEKDSDGDGYNDTYEVQCGSDPYDNRSTPNDIDGDGVPNENDAYPDDPDRWKADEKTKSEAIWWKIGVAVVVIVGVFVGLVLLKRKKSGKKKSVRYAEEVGEENDELEGADRDGECHSADLSQVLGPP